MPDISKLRQNQLQVLELDRKGMTPGQISTATGIGLSTVSDIKNRLRQLGFTVRQQRIRNEYELQRSEFEPEDDELPDLDEAIPANVPRCHCGMTLPCEHEPMPVFLRHDNDATYPDEIDDVSELSRRLGAWEKLKLGRKLTQDGNFRRANASQAPQLAAAATPGSAPTQAR